MRTFHPVFTEKAASEKQWDITIEEIGVLRAMLSVVFSLETLITF